MGTIRIVAESAMDAPAERVYGYLADYREHHPKILPPAFIAFAVEEGGIGAGTINRYSIKVGGRTRTARQRVTEPVPGRILREADIDGSAVTTFTVTPEDARCHVRIETTYEGSRGVMGALERIIVPRLLGKIYADELIRLNAYARQNGH
jgi:hypothetical protein